MYGILFNAPNGKIQPIQFGQMQNHAKVAVTATALFPRTAILNHSCDPNIRNCFNGNFLTIKSTRAISGSEEIFNGYCSSYKLLDTANRKQLLKDQYSFDCDCSKCVESEDLLLAVCKMYFFHSFLINTFRCTGIPIVHLSNKELWPFDCPQHHPIEMVASNGCTQ